MNTRDIREAHGMSRKEFSERLGIPYSTVQKWELGVRNCPPYLLELIKYRLDHEKK